MKHYVLGFAFDLALDQLVLIEKARPDWQRGRFNGVGGAIEAEEDPIDAMVREFREETGIEIYSWMLLGTLTGHLWDCRTYVAFDDRMKHCRTTTDERIEFFHPQDLPANVIPNLRWLVPAALGRYRDAYLIDARY